MSNVITKAFVACSLLFGLSTAVSSHAQTTGISASQNAQGNVVLDFTFNERKTGGMWLSAYENNVYSYTTVSGATETSLANGYWRYVYTTTLHCDAGDQFKFRIQGNYSRVDWLPGPTDATYLNYACSNAGSSASSQSSSVPAPATAPTVNAIAGNGSVALNWNAIANATSYRINYGFSTATLGSSLTTPSTTISVSGLSNGFAYDFTVAAVNAAGEKISSRVTATPQAASSVSSVASSSKSSAVTTSAATSSAAYVFGLQSNGLAYHPVGNQTANWVYLCLNGDCRTAVKNGSRYEYSFSVTAGTNYSLQFKVQDNASGQCIATITSVAPGGGVTNSPCATGGASSAANTSANSSSKNSSVQSSLASSTASSVSSANNWPAASTRLENGVLISTYAERFRVRHELSVSDFNNFNIEYWVARFGSVELRDYTRPEAASQRQAACNTTQPCVVVTLQGAVPAAMSDSGGNNKDCNQQVPNWRYHKIYGDETNFMYGAVMDIVLPDGSTVAGCNATQAQRNTATKWRAVMQPWQNIDRPFAQGAQIEFETTISFDRAQITGDNVNYYGQTMRYVLGQGFVVNNRDPMIGPTNINDSFAQLGGATTVPQLSASGGAQQRFAYSQHAYNMGANHIADWLMGRRVLHSNMSTGEYIEEFMPGPQAVNGNLPMPELAGMATNAIQPSCTQCHSLNTTGNLQAPRQDVVPPKLIGLGLIEAIPEATIRSWATQNGGRVSNVTVNGVQQVGRYGWRAQTATIRQQIAKALHDDMGVGSSFTGFGPQEISDQRLDQLTTYIKLVAVPTPRTNLTAHAGHNLFNTMGCAACHKMTATTGVDANFPELSNQTIHPYTDVLLHDLGEGYFRTAPLWGIGLSAYVRSGNNATNSLMHDGASTTFDAAIARHNGEAATAKANYNAASAANKQSLLDYLNNL